jgi:hypothetical protein
LRSAHTGNRTWCASFCDRITAVILRPSSFRTVDTILRGGAAECLDLSQVYQLNRRSEAFLRPGVVAPRSLVVRPWPSGPEANMDEGGYGEDRWIRASPRRRALLFRLPSRGELVKGESAILAGRLGEGRDLLSPARGQREFCRCFLASRRL